MYMYGYDILIYTMIDGYITTIISNLRLIFIIIICMYIYICIYIFVICVTYMSTCLCIFICNMPDKYMCIYVITYCK